MRYNPEVDRVRYCTGCRRWFHLGCLQPLDTVANLRQSAALQITDATWWVLWKARANIPKRAADDLESLVTLPIQRVQLGRPSGAHPLLSNEVFSLALRDAVKSPSFQCPSTTNEAHQWLNGLLRTALLDHSEMSILQGSAIVRWLASIPLKDRIIMRCPHSSRHVL